MEKCAKLLIENGQIKSVLSEISCTPDVVTQYPNWFIVVGLIILLIAVWFIWFYPLWNVWASKKSGEAALQEAYREQKIQIAKAEARKQSAVLNKESAIIEAEAVSEQVSKIGKELTNHDLYLKWQWIKMMEEKPNGSVIYVPTEAGLPILEAGKRD